MKKLLKILLSKDKIILVFFDEKRKIWNLIVPTLFTNKWQIIKISIKISIKGYKIFDINRKKTVKRKKIHANIVKQIESSRKR